ncbi:MAG: nitrate ABC transporter permease [Lautropia sp.]|nr:nitrate ABC transporter permease [Lautropia sp.]
MTRGVRESLKAALLSVLVFVLFVGIWGWLTRPQVQRVADMTPQQIEYAQLMGKLPEDPARLAAIIRAGEGVAGAVPLRAAGGFPTPAETGAAFVRQLSDPFRDNGPNDKGIAWQLGASLLRVAAGFGLAVLVALPLGFLIGMSPLASRALHPFIQVLKPISPLAWMPIALFTIKDASASAIFVIFICSIWPMLVNTAFGVAHVRREWLNVARTLEVGLWRRIVHVILPAAAPTLLTGMRISMGIAWLVIVAAEMLVGGTGIGYFVWNEWNNFALANVIFAIVVIGLVGMLLDTLFARAQKAVTYVE